LNNEVINIVRCVPPSLKLDRPNIKKQVKFLICIAMVFCLTKTAEARSYAMTVDSSTGLVLMDEKQNLQLSKDLRNACEIAKFFLNNTNVETTALGNGQEKRTTTSIAVMIFDKKIRSTISELKKTDPSNDMDPDAMDRLFTLLSSIKTDWKSVSMFGTDQEAARILWAIDQQKGSYSTLAAEVTRTAFKCTTKSIRYTRN